MNRPQRPPHPAPCPSPEQVTDEQVNTVLLVIDALQTYLLPIHVDSSVPGRETRMEGEPRIAAEVTFMKACSKLDDILDDAARWTLKGQQEVYTALTQAYLQQFEFLRSQTMASNSLSRPFFLLKPELAKLEDGTFIAYWGDVETDGCGLIGRGKTPAEAFGDFDAAYFRQNQIRIEPPPPEEPPAKKTRKKK